MKRPAALLVCGLAACQSAPEAQLAPQVAVLHDAPSRPYEALAPLRARGAPGGGREDAYRELRAKAGRLGADAVIVRDELTRYRDPPTEDPRHRLNIGEAYPGPLHAFGDDPFPAAGRVHYGGAYYVVDGLAIRFTSEG